MKYIDADKLIAKIRKLRSESCISESDDYYEYAKSEIIDIIHHLQQELSEAARAQYVNERVAEIFPEQDNDFLSEEDLRKVIRNTARHFFELGLNARKEE